MERGGGGLGWEVGRDGGGVGRGGGVRRGRSGVCVCDISNVFLLHALDEYFMLLSTSSDCPYFHVWQVQWR